MKNTNENHRYLMGPLTATVDGGRTTYALGADRSSIQLDSGSSVTTQTITISPGSGSGTGTVSISGIREGTNALSTSALNWHGLTITPNLLNNTVTISGSKADAGTYTGTFYVEGKIGYNNATPAIFTINIAPASAASLTASPSTVRGKVGETMQSTPVKISSGSLNVVVGDVYLTGSKGTTKNLGVNFAKSTISDDYVLVYGTPTADGTFTVTVEGTAGTNQAGNAFITIDIAEAAAATPTTPTINITPSRTISRTLSQATASTITLGASNSGTLAISKVSSTNSAAGTNDLTCTWNGLKIQASNTAVTVTGTAASTGTETFTLVGTIGGTSVTQTFTVTVVADTAVPTSYFGAISNWTKSVYQGSNSVILNIPLTDEFINAFGTGGTIQTSDISKIVASVSGGTPLNPADGTVQSYSISGNATSGYTLRMTLTFNPAAAASNWYSGIALTGLSITGKNGQVINPSISGASYSSIPDASSGGGGGGCDVGTAGFALLAFAMIAASAARKKTR
ncbi:MAG: hypothetical protein LBG29_00230 [Synergistaceae bacterium]|nr:hypothetical protein [Synergistaceae bacterium]